MTSCKDERRFSIGLEGTGILSRLEGVGTGVNAGAAAAAKVGGGDAGLALFWSLLVFRSLVPFSACGGVLLDLGVAGSVGVRGAGGKLSLR